MRIAFLGLRKMGVGMAARLASAGHTLAVFNRTAARAELLARFAVRVATSARDAAHNADVIIGMTADDDSSRAMWLGDAGALAAQNAPDALAIECSTLSYDWVLELSEKVRARGFRYVDSPVTGLPDAAASGTLTLLVGADPADLDAARPVFASLATRVLHFGAVGQGTVYKLMVNLLGAVQIASAAEGMALVERAGLDQKLVADAIASGQAASPQVVRNVRRFVAGDHSTGVAHCGQRTKRGGTLMRSVIAAARASSVTPARRPASRSRVRAPDGDRARARCRSQRRGRHPTARAATRACRPPAARRQARCGPAHRPCACVPRRRR